MLILVIKILTVVICTLEIITDFLQSRLIKNILEENILLPLAISLSIIFSVVSPLFCIFSELLCQYSLLKFMKVPVRLKKKIKCLFILLLIADLIALVLFTFAELEFFSDELSFVLLNVAQCMISIHCWTSFKLLYLLAKKEKTAKKKSSKLHIPVTQLSTTNSYGDIYGLRSSYDICLVLWYRRNTVIGAIFIAICLFAIFTPSAVIGFAYYRF
ncbi:hypothetical protein HDU92_004327 [Lobulomyces angularis]|nr:hypothetical protein HDU92_004327 [Lobulomyces angularis]